MSDDILARYTSARAIEAPALLLKDAIEEVKKLREEIARLQKALEPLSDEELNEIIEGAFAKLGKYLRSGGARGQTFRYQDSPEYWVVGTTIEHLRARAAIREGGKE